jgi:hypothetical protein
LGGDSEHAAAFIQVRVSNQQHRGEGGGGLCLNVARWNMAVKPIMLGCFCSSTHSQ